MTKDDVAAQDERADLLAYLDRRIANAAAIAGSSAAHSETRELAVDRRQQLEVIRDEIAQGMHLGAAAIAAKLNHDSAAAIAAKLNHDSAAALAAKLNEGAVG